MSEDFPESRAPLSAGASPPSPLDTARILEERLQRLSTLIATAPLNLVSAAERPHVRARHVDEAVAAAAALPCHGGQRWLDLGTGGGLPGLVLACCRLDVHWALLDSTRKKTRQVERFVMELGLDNVAVLTGRAETLAHDPRHRGAFDGVVARAVAPMDVLAELARGFLRSGGVLAALKGPAWQDETTEARAALRLLRYGAVHSAALASPARSTWLVTIPARGRPPDGYPRRDGLPRVDPLR